MAILDLVQLDDAAALFHGKPRANKVRPLPIKYRTTVSLALWNELNAHLPARDLVLELAQRARLNQAGAIQVWRWRRDGGTTLMNSLLLQITIGNQTEALRLSPAMVESLMPESTSDEERASRMADTLMSIIAMSHSVQDGGGPVANATYTVANVERIS